MDRKTTRLCDAAWDAVPLAWSGFFIALVGSLPALFAWTAYDPPHIAWRIAATMLALACWAFCFVAVGKWAAAIENLREWRNEMEARLDAQEKAR